MTYDSTLCAPHHDLRLPIALTRDDAPRRIGVEIEFAGLTEEKTARLAADELGGAAKARADHVWSVEDTAIGTIRVELDTAFKDATGRVAEVGLELVRGIVPVEIVSAPLTEDQLPALDQFLATLREAGAIGSRQGVLLGFGVHFNPEISGPDAADIVPVLRAYALLEDWLRLRYPIDTSRRLLPFVDRYPAELVDALASKEAGDWSLERLADVYLTHVRSRNHGLDLLPLLAHLDAPRVEAALGPDAVSGARPTWHFRLPDCRIDEPDWSLFQAWELWIMVERLAVRPDLLATLAQAWRQRREKVLPGLESWAAQADSIVASAGGLK